MSFVERASARAKRFEGFYLVAYLDPKNLWTTAYGFNIERAGAAQALASVGVLSADVWAEIEHSRRVGLVVTKTASGPLKTTHNPVVTKEQADRLLDNDIAESIADLRTIVPAFDAMPDEAKLVLTDMHFNMGGSKLRGFQRHTIPALLARDYEEAARCIEASDYGRDKFSKKRAAENVALLRRIA